MNNAERPFYWTDQEMAFYANEIVNRICREALVLGDSTTRSVCEIPTVVNAMDYTLSSSIIYVRSAKIITQEILTLDVAPATAWATGDTITGATSLKTCTIVSKSSDYSYIIDSRNGEFTLGEVLSNGTYAADQGATYPQVDEYRSSMLEKLTQRDMNRYQSAWRASTAAKPYRYIVDYTSGQLTLFPKPDDIYIIKLSVFRYPLVGLTSTNMSAQTIEIDSRYEDIVINGICAQAFLKSGDNTYDPKKAGDFGILTNKAISAIKIRNMLYNANNEIAEPVGAFT